MEYPVVSESRETIEKQKGGGRDTGDNLKELPMAKAVTTGATNINNNSTRL